MHIVDDFNRQKVIKRIFKLLPAHVMCAYYTHTYAKHGSN